MAGQGKGAEFPVGAPYAPSVVWTAGKGKAGDGKGMGKEKKGKGKESLWAEHEAALVEVPEVAVDVTSASFGLGGVALGPQQSCGLLCARRGPNCQGACILPRGNHPDHPHPASMHVCGACMGPQPKRPPPPLLSVWTPSAPTSSSSRPATDKGEQRGKDKGIRKGNDKGKGKEKGNEKGNQRGKGEGNGGASAWRAWCSGRAAAAGPLRGVPGALAAAGGGRGGSRVGSWQWSWRCLGCDAPDATGEVAASIRRLDATTPGCPRCGVQAWARRLDPP